MLTKYIRPCVYSNMWLTGRYWERDSDDVNINCIYEVSVWWKCTKRILVWWLRVSCVTSFNFPVFVFVLQPVWKHTFFCFIFPLLVLLYIYFMNCLLYKKCYSNSRVTSYYLVVVIKQTTEVKALLLMSHNFQTFALSCLRRSVAVLSLQRFGFEHGSFCLVFVTENYWHWCWVFSWYFPFPCQYHYTNATYSHNDHRRRYIISRLAASLNKISLRLP
jgi:hypothetical protein